VTNAIRHSGCSIVHVRLKYDSDCLNMAVGDNGRGFQVPDSAVRNGHFGIPVMQERSRKLGGTFRIQTSPGSGTEISLKVGFRTIHPLSDQQQHVVPWIGV
jgi:signal transduction histidine kinase